MATFEIEDTICAISTPHGSGGIAVLRISGPNALEISDKIWKGRSLLSLESHKAVLGNIVNSSGEIVDQSVVTIFKGPKSYTGEDTVEFSVHGSKWIQREVLRLLVDKGARLAEPGEFTRRAFANGRMNLAEAEAVGDLISSESRAAARVALNQMKGSVTTRLNELRSKLLELASLLELELDFSEEDVEFASRQKLQFIANEIHSEISRLLETFHAGSAIKEGIPVAIVGSTNAGKSSLLNALIGDNRAIVSDIHGTTRDTIEECVLIGDYQFRFIDTAGFRKTEDVVERLGIERSRQALSKARIVLGVIDSSNPVDPEISGISSDAIYIPLYNKCDIAECPDKDALQISAVNGTGIEALKILLQNKAKAFSQEADVVLITNERHADALRKAQESSIRLLEGLEQSLPGDFLAQDLREILHHLGTISGEITTPEILRTIFSTFCIGK